MSHALATVLHRGRKAASNVMAACLASSREARWKRPACGGGAWQTAGGGLNIGPFSLSLSLSASLSKNEATAVRR